MPSENEIAVGRFWDAFWSKGDQSVAEEIFDPNFRDYDPYWPSGVDGGIPAIIEKNSVFYGLLPDLRCTVLKWVIAGDTIVTHWEANGTHQGEFAGISPTGNPISITGISIHTCRDGKIVEQIIAYDFLGLLRQMGATTIPDGG
jgi:predicted ester cyclase